MDDLNNTSAGFKTVVNSKAVQHHFINNSKGTQVGICNFGARITHFKVLNHLKLSYDIVLGFDDIQGYFNANERYHGVTVGPYANRIGGAKFSTPLKEYYLDANDGQNTLHSGSAGFHDEVWEFESLHSNSVSLKLTHQHLKGGFPADIVCKVSFSLNDDNELCIDYLAIANQDTIINLTNHAYFNLNGEGNGTILNHQVQINADKFVAIDASSIPTGELKNVGQTPFDFRKFKLITNDIETDDDQLKNGNGYDHSFHLLKTNQNLSFAAAAIGDESKIKLEVFTTEPGVQFYTGNFLNGKDEGKSGVFYEKQTGFCFETQHHPDSPNQPQFPSTFLAMNKEFKSSTIYKVSFG